MFEDIVEHYPVTEHVFALPGAPKAHLTVAVFAIILYLVLINLYWKMLNHFQPAFFKAVDGEPMKQWEQAMLMVSTSMHLIGVGIALCILHLGSEPVGTLSLLFYPEKANVFYMPLEGYCCSYYLGYFVIDFSNYIYMQDSSPLGRQTMAHHVVVTAILVFALTGGMCMPKLAAVAMICEISQYFLNIRTIMGKQRWTGPYQFANNVAFFLAFTTFRIIFFPFLLRSHIQLALYYNFDATGAVFRAFYYVNAVLFLFIVCLNFLWYYLVLKGFVRLVTTGSTVQEKPDSDDYEKQAE